MKLYLSSYGFGNESEIKKLKKLIPKNNKIGHINNALDFIGKDLKRATESQNSEIDILNDIGFKAEKLNLVDYFNNEELLRKKINSLGSLWVCGGNTFVLRQAMRLSGFDNIFQELKSRKEFLYSGYSAGICILSDSLKPISNVDDPNNFPYQEINKTIWDGLRMFDYSLLPHYNSDHFESEEIGKEVQRCIDNKWLFKTLRDGEVIIIE